MSITDHRPAGEVPWYRLKSSIVMITVTVLAVLGLLLDPASDDIVPAASYRIVDNGTIMNGSAPQTR